MHELRLAAAFAVVLAAVACRTELPPMATRPMPEVDRMPPLLGAQRPRSPRIASYRIAATLDATAKRITGVETLTWRHTGVVPVARVPLHLYMNAFRDDSSLYLRESGGRGVRGGEPRQRGWIDLSSARVDGVDLVPTGRFGEDQTTLELTLPRAVFPGETIAIDLRFEVQLPRVVARTGYSGELIMAGQWFPKIGVLTVEHGEQKWHCAPLYHNSEFFADFGVYDVELTVPDTHIVAATGVLTGARAAGPGTRTLTFRAEDVHDFVWMADPWMKVLRGRAATAAGDVEIRVYHRPGYERWATRHLEAARRTIESFSSRYVPYAWPLMSVIDVPWEAAQGMGGMEYPMLVTTGGALPIDGQYVTEQVTVHEVGHNWFQGMLASNEVDEAWLDEGVNEYVDGVLLDDWFGEDRSELDLPFFRIGYTGFRRLGNLEGLAWPIATPSYEISPHEYGAITYGKTALALKTLEGMVGREKLVGALGLYARRHAFSHPTRDDFFDALEDGLGADYRWFLEPAFLGTGLVDYRVAETRVRPAGGGGWTSEVTLERVGTVPAALEVELRFSDGEARLERWDGLGRSHRISLTRAAPLVSVEIDPHGKLALEQRALDDSQTSVDRGGEWRAGARAGFWLQTLEQLVGI